MINISLKLIGMNQLLGKFKEKPVQVARAISRAIKESSFVLEAESKQALTTGWTRAIRTGRLRSENVVRELSDIKAAVYPLVQYGIYVHEGTFKMRARPWFTEAAKTAGPKIRQIFDDEIARSLK